MTQKKQKIMTENELAKIVFESGMKIKKYFFIVKTICSANGKKQSPLSHPSL